MGKVFGIGANKTGTTSLKNAFKILGLTPVASWRNSKHLVGHFVRGDYGPMMEFAKGYRSFQDAPWCYGELYKILAGKFRDAKFILTERDSESWFKSILRWHTEVVRFGRGKWNLIYKPYCKAYDLSCDIPMTPKNIIAQKEIMVRSYDRRNAEIKEYFGSELLVIDVRDQPWEALCEFLEVEVPDVPFPHSNKHKRRRRRRKS
jgi:hypothetical protein